MTPRDGGDAFPSPGVVLMNQGGVPHQQGAYAGMTLRDYFAAMALSAMELQICVGEPAAEHMATSAYVVADAMLKAREA